MTDHEVTIAELREEVRVLREDNDQLRAEVERLARNLRDAEEQIGHAEFHANLARRAVNGAL